MAMTSVESYALRRAAIGLGDRLGLGLYDNGKTDALVKNSLQRQDRQARRAESEQEATEKLLEGNTPTLRIETADGPSAARAVADAFAHEKQRG
jgi:hypothetical protein